MGVLRMMVVVLTGAVCLCGLYSGLDIKYGDKGFLCWSVFCMLVTVLSGGPFYATVAAALMAGGKAGGLEPFTVLVVSVFASKLLYSHVFPDRVDDVQVARRPYEEEIRDILFRNDPSKLHLVDAELDRYRGREKKLLRELERKFAPRTGPSSTVVTGYGGYGVDYGVDRSSGALAGGGGDGDLDSGADEQKSVVQLAHEEETRRVQATIEASLQRITNRIDRRRR